MSNGEEAQHVVDISLKKIASWRTKRSGGADLHRNLLLASVLIKAHSACTESALANLDDQVTTTSASPTTDDDVCSDVSQSTLSDFENSREDLGVEGEDPVQSWDVIPDQALEELEFFGLDSTCEQIKDTGKSVSIKDKSHDDIEAESIKIAGDHELNEISKSSNSQTKKRKLEAIASENDNNTCKRRRSESSVDCERLCMDFDALISSIEDDCTVSVAETLNASGNFAGQLVESYEQSVCDAYFDDLDYSTNL